MPDNPGVTRRVHVDRVSVGEVHLAADQAHHLRDVLRLNSGDEIEVFDADGRVASAKIVRDDADMVLLVEHFDAALCNLHLTIYSAVPKGDRAEWMIEKLSELGVTRFVPLRTQRSVVHPEGKGKLGRWERIAIESAKQSRRAGVMKIDPLASLSQALTPPPGTRREGGGEGQTVANRANLPHGNKPFPQPSPSVPGEGVRRLFLSTLPDAPSILKSLDPTPASLDLFIGPEGGWSQEEIGQFAGAGLTGVRLTTTILRIETAAVAAASVVGTFFSQDRATT